MSAPNRVLVSGTTRKRLEGELPPAPNGTPEIKGHGALRSWWLETVRPED